MIHRRARLFAAIAAACLTAVIAVSDERNPPSYESVRELMAISNTEGAARELGDHFEKVVRSKFDSMTEDRTLSPEVLAILARFQKEMVPVLKDAVSWEKLEPIYLDSYRELFTQEEVDQIIVFFRTAAGKAMVEKMPRVGTMAASVLNDRIWPPLEALQAAVLKDLEDQLKKEANQALQTTPVTPEKG